MVLTILLAACTSAPQKATVIRANEEKSSTGEVNTFQMKLKMHGEEVGGANIGKRMLMPEMGAAYRFQNGKMQFRLDVPGEMYPDKQARILLSDKDGYNPKLYLKSTGNLDYSLSTDASEMLNQMSRMGVMSDLMDKRQPFKKLTTDRFLVMAKQAAYDITQNKNKVIVTRTSTRENMKMINKMYFDEQVGAIVQNDTQFVSPEFTSTSSVSVNYTDIKGYEDLAIPYKFETRIVSDLQGDAKLPTVTMPESEEIPEGQQYQLKADEYVAQEYTSDISGEGIIDPNHSETHVVMEYEDIKINETSEDFFQLDNN